MKRNWKLIRAILREEDTATWPELVILEHKALCSEAGYIRAHVMRSMHSKQVQIVQFSETWLTPDGVEAAEVLANADDLDAVLAELDAKNVGHVSDIVFAMMRKRALDRLAESSWFKANPNLGCGKSLEYMADQAAKAALSPGKMRDFLTKQLDKRAEKAVGGWLSMDKWDECAGEAMTQPQVLARLAGKPVFCGFDASRSQDLAAVALAWSEGERVCCAWLFFTPEDSLRERELSDRAPYAEWVRTGWLTTTPGNITDYREIESAVVALLKTARARPAEFPMMKPEFTVNGRKFPRGEIDMELQYAIIIKRGARKVFIGRGVNKHEAAPFIEFLKRKGVEVVIG